MYISLILSLNTSPEIQEEIWNTKFEATGGVDSTSQNSR
jgi:hypothetical protein